MSNSKSKSPADFYDNNSMEPRTQLEFALAGEITPEMERAAGEEPHLEPDDVRAEIGGGRMVLPASRVHLEQELQPVAIGRAATTKINANLGTSEVASSRSEELEKLRTAVRWGADTVMDLSTGGDLNEIRRSVVESVDVPLGTVPLYSMIVDRPVEEIDREIILAELKNQARQGVDFFTIHAGLLASHLELTEARLAGIVSRGGSLIAQWMRAQSQENPFYENFDEICELMREYDVSISLGDGLRPGAQADATDEAQLAELEVLGELTERAWEHGLQVLVEGPGHVPFNQIEENMNKQQQICHGAPFYVLGPLVSDIFPGYDHITGAIGATAAAYHGASLLCYVTPKEHLGLPDAEAVKQGCVAHKIAAHSADVARGLPKSRRPDDAISRARAELDWDQQFKHCFDPQKARKIRREECEATGEDLDDYCSMCGKDWCAVEKNNELEEER